MHSIAFAICILFIAATLVFQRRPSFAAARNAEPAAAPQSPAKPAWPHRHRHFWSACCRAWFGQPVAI